MTLPLKRWLESGGLHLIPRIEVEIADLEPTIEAEDVEDAVRSCFGKETELELRVSLSKTPYRANRKAYVLLEVARALKLLKGAQIKIGWVSWRDRKKKEMNRCFRCLGFGHIAANCRGLDHSRCCWRCGEDGHLAGRSRPRDNALRGFSGGSPQKEAVKSRKS